MNFKEALIAHLQGERVEVNYNNQGWSCFSKEFSAIPLDALKPFYDASGYEFRIKPRTITVNGREVPEPVMQPLSIGAKYFVPRVDSEELYLSGSWYGYDVSFRRLKHGLIHLTKEAAIAHAKAMLNID